MSSGRPWAITWSAPSKPPIQKDRKGTSVGGSGVEAVARADIGLRSGLVLLVRGAGAQPGRQRRGLLRQQLFHQLGLARGHLLAQGGPVHLVAGLLALLEELAFLFLDVVRHVLAQHREGGG